MFNVHAGMVPDFLQFHAVQERFVNAVGHTAAEGGSVVVFLDFPNGNRIDRGRKCAVDAASKGAKRCSVPGNGCESPRIIVQQMALRVRFDEHVHNAVKYAGALFLPFCLLSGSGQCFQHFGFSSLNSDLAR